MPSDEHLTDGNGEDMNKLGFIGMGNMAQAIADGFIKSGAVAGENIHAYAPNAAKLKANADRIGFCAVGSMKELTDACDTLIMACKPYQIPAIIRDHGDSFSGKALISIALGWDFVTYSKVLPDDTRVQFVMPNTPAKVGEGVFLFEALHSLEDDERMQVMDAFSRLGMVTELPPNLMGIGGAITGCGPAFIDLYIEAMGDVAVKYGLPRKQAYELVSATVKGSAALQLETGIHPGELKDAVCSPGGSTIRGVSALEATGFRASCMSAIDEIMSMYEE